MLHHGRAEVLAEVGSGSNLSDLMRVIGVPPEMVMLYQVNGKVERSDYLVRDGDEVVAIPAVAGG